MKKTFILICYLVTVICYSTDQSNGNFNSHTPVPPEEIKSHANHPGTAETTKPIRPSLAQENLSLSPETLYRIRRRLPHTLKPSPT